MCLVCAGFVCMYVFVCVCVCFFFFKQKTAYEMRISDWSSDVCSSDLEHAEVEAFRREPVLRQVDAVELAVVALAVLQVVEDLQGGAERVGGDRKSVV